MDVCELSHNAHGGKNCILGLVIRELITTTQQGYE